MTGNIRAQSGMPASDPLTGGGGTINGSWTSWFEKMWKRITDGEKQVAAHQAAIVAANATIDQHQIEIESIKARLTAGHL